ncbi:hypothetical protein C2E21_0211 [Chlorella sorokiniana]|uniref:BP28 C-terminal domain-containing protein n=1 Tax=Chlorella sorokiniana TaxID=3076 RepID=A0A2P6U5N1_CHLSO|nr:hypothetical protein C2E21_0211 [Chlorella sorokiniana]|eukprot:PRW61623.1 hypothetical protein C2E21_0211 [Chlorella sorokiniana]
MSGKAKGGAPKAAPQTDLQAQLQQLAVTQGVDQGRRHRGKASLLYSLQEAADIDAETIQRIGIEGLDQLCALDGRFHAYRRTLFAAAMAGGDRDTNTADMNKQLDTAVAGFCALLSSYFLLAPAFKALEWLVRKYRVHERNVDDLMMAALPYHETEQFVRLVQILRLDPRSRWAFLEPMQHSGAPVPREVLVLRCITDRSLLRFVCDTAQRQSEPQYAGRAFLPFYAVLTCELLDKVPAVDEPLTSMLLPYMLAGMRATAVADYRAATYMIIGQLASKATFSDQLVLGMVEEMCGAAAPAQLGSVVMLLAHLANCQEYFNAMPPKAFKQLTKVPGLVDQLAELSDKGCRVGRLLELLVAVAMDQLPKHPHYEQLLQSMMARVQLGNAARVLAERVLQRAAAADSESGDEAAAAQHAQHLRLLRSLDQRCPEALDAAVNAVLPAQQQGQEGQQQKGSSGGGQQEERRQRMLALLSAAFEGTARCVMLEAGTTLLAAAEAPAAGMRQLAVQRLDALAAAAPPGSEAAAAAGTALLRRLHDDSPTVVQAVLDAPSLLRLPPAAVFDGLASCFDRAMQQASDRATKKSDRAAARGVLRKTLKLLMGPLVDSSPALLPRVLPLLLATLFVGPSCGPKVASTAAKAARKLEHPLLAGLRALPLPREGDDDAEQPAAAAAPKSAKKGSKKGERAGVKEQQAEHSKAAADAVHNARVVAALAGEAASNSAAAAALVQLLADAASGDVLPGIHAAEPLLLLLAHAAVRHGGPGAAAISLAQVQQLQAQPVAAAVAAALAAGPLPSECFEEGGTPTGPLLAQLAAGTLAVPSLRSTVLLAALRAVPWPELAPRGDKDVLPLLRALCSLNWQPALTALLARVAEAQQDAPLLLSDLFAAPPEAEPLDVQRVAAQQAAALLQQWAATAARSKKAAGQQGEAGVALLARCAAVLSHPDRHVREAAVQCTQACAKLVQSVPNSGLSDAACKVLGIALAEQASWLAADAEAAQQLFEAVLGADDEPTQQLAPYVLGAADAQSLGSVLLAAAEVEVAAAAGSGGRRDAAVALYVARQLLAFVVPWAPAEQLLASCQKLLAGAAAVGTPAPGSAAAQEQDALLAEAAVCFTAQRLEQVLAGPGTAAAAAVVDTWCSLMEPAAAESAAAARLSALQQANQRIFELLPSSLQGRCLKVLLRVASKDADESCRAAARAALAALPLQAEALMPLLAEGAGHAAAGADVEMADAAQAGDEEQDEVMQQLLADAAAAAAKVGTPRAKQRRGKAGSSKEEQAAAEAAAAVERRREQLAAQRAARQQGRPAAERQQAGAALPAAGGSQECVAALELLQWKENVQHSLLLVPALQAIAEAQLAQLSAAAEAAAGGEEQPAEQAAAAAEVVYVLQLCLSALRSLAQAFRQSAAAAGAPPSAAKPKGKKGKQQQQQQPEGGAAFDLGLAVRAAQLAPDGAVRNAALALIAELATGMPQAALDHVLDVVAVVGTSAALQQDEHSERVAAQALQAILPAWTGAGKSLQQLAEAVVGALPRVSPHRRLPLLAGLVSALPEVDGLCSVLALLLDTAVVQQAAAAAGDAQMADADAAAAAAEEVEPAWAADLAADLMEQAPMLLQASASAALLEHSMQASQQQPWQALPLLSVAFVTQHLEQRAGGASAAAAEELAAAFQRLMQATLLQLQGLGERQAAAQKGTAAAPAVLLRTGTAGCYRLLRALQLHMPAAAFLSALVSLASSSPADRVRRKALQLLASAVRDAAEGMGWQAEGQTPEAAAGVADAALSACKPAVALLQAPKGKAAAPGWEPTSPLTKQTALAAVGSVAAAFGAQRPDQLLAVLPAVLAAVRDEQAAVRGSALAATASLAAALGPRLVPQLPQTVAAVIAAVEAAAAAVTKAAEADGSSSSSKGGSSSSSESEGEDGAVRGAQQSTAAGGVSESAALELAAALAAVAALVEHLGAFLAPHLPLLLGVLLHPAVLQCSAARCADVAQAIRRQLAQAVPARLLLPPLLAQLEPAAEAGSDSAVALLRVLSAAVDAMDAATLASHHEAVFGALLRALDLRRRRPTALLAHSGGVDQCEAAAVQAFVGLTMRLTEARFKPLFFRLLEWAHAVPAGDSDLPVGTGQLLRSLSLFSLVNALAEKLRGVFVPYYGLLLDVCVAHLSDSSIAAGKKSKKKKRKSEAVAAEEGQAAPSPADDPLYVEHDWRLRLKVIRALHRCFLYDTGAGGAARFLDEARFQRLLPPLVAHLGLRPPAALAPALEADGAVDGAAALEASLQLGAGAEGAAEGAAGSAAAAGLDAFGRAVVACLAQLAVTAGSDAQWKPLNHQVLMMTRSLEPRTRLLALETVAQLVGRLSEEYLALLPETLPFLAELLEDPELAVEARAQQLVRALEALSGESLDQYLR